MARICYVCGMHRTGTQTYFNPSPHGVGHVVCVHVVGLIPDVPQLLRLTCMPLHVVITWLVFLWDTKSSLIVGVELERSPHETSWKGCSAFTPALPRPIAFFACLALVCDSASVLRERVKDVSIKERNELIRVWFFMVFPVAFCLRSNVLACCVSFRLKTDTYGRLLASPTGQASKLRQSHHLYLRRLKPKPSPGTSTLISRWTLLCSRSLVVRNTSAARSSCQRWWTLVVHWSPPWPQIWRHNIHWDPRTSAQAIG